VFGPDKYKMASSSLYPHEWISKLSGILRCGKYAYITRRALKERKDTDRKDVEEENAGPAAADKRLKDRSD
jgi:hypothetical protein